MIKEIFSCGLVIEFLAMLYLMVYSMWKLIQRGNQERTNKYKKGDFYEMGNVLL